MSPHRSTARRRWGYERDPRVGLGEAGRRPASPGTAPARPRTRWLARAANGFSRRLWRRAFHTCTPTLPPPACSAPRRRIGPPQLAGGGLPAVEGPQQSAEGSSVAANRSLDLGGDVRSPTNTRSSTSPGWAGAAAAAAACMSRGGGRAASKQREHTPGWLRFGRARDRSPRPRAGGQGTATRRGGGGRGGRGRGRLGGRGGRLAGGPPHPAPPRRRPPAPPPPAAPPPAAPPRRGTTGRLLRLWGGASCPAAVPAPEVTGRGASRAARRGATAAARPARGGGEARDAAGGADSATVSSCV